MILYGKYDKEFLINWEDEPKIQSLALKNHGKSIKIEILQMSKKSRQQECYYWGVILKELASELGYKSKELHTYFKYLTAVEITKDFEFNQIPFITIDRCLEYYNKGNELMIELVNFNYSTRTYTKERYMILINIALEFADKAGVFIPEPKKD